MRVSRKQEDRNIGFEADEEGRLVTKGLDVEDEDDPRDIDVDRLSEDEDEEDEEDEEEDINEEKLAEALGKSINKEVTEAVYSARYLGPFLAFFGLLLGYKLTISPYKISILDRKYSRIQDLGLVRPLLSSEEMHQIRDNTRNGETNFLMPLPSYDQIKLRFHSAATPKGIHQLPEMFYAGVVFGLTDENSHELRYTNHDIHLRRNLAEAVDQQESALYLQLKSMRPTPTAIMPRSVQNNQTEWSEKGYALYFSFEDLKAQGKLSSDKLKPWKRVLEDVMHIAREYRQVYITAWYPHVFGEQDEKTQKRFKDPYRYTTIIQQILPTRTGMYDIGSTVPVWMSAVNHTVPEKKPQSHILRKEWTVDDHWDDYKPGGKKYVKYTKRDLEEMVYELNTGVTAVGYDLEQKKEREL